MYQTNKEIQNTFCEWFVEFFEQHLTEVSKFLSLILRHKPEAIGIELDEHGWVNVDELIAGIGAKYPGFGMDILEEIVRTDEKQRSNTWIGNRISRELHLTVSRRMHT